ncbi:MAG: carboxypeptidase M32 [candidate division Zixibacteria bacterium]|nr:carboxypeptidase M32 [candidate division Zixibacteria bacterium]
MSAKEDYQELEKRARELGLIGASYALLEWDHQVNMPPKSAETRAEMTSYLAGMMHEKFVDPKVGELISSVESSDLVKDPESIIAANIRELRHQYDKETKLPKELVEEFEKTTALAHGIWAEARKNNDFKTFEPALKKIVDLTKQKAEAYGYEGEPYNALLDNYEPGATTAEVADVFEKLRVELVELLAKIKDAPNQPDGSIIERPYDVKNQQIFGELVAKTMGYDFDEGRLDIATHPFTTAFGPGDTRITTRYNPNRLNDALFGTIHEAGHALYEMGLKKKENFGMPVGDSASLGIHESQSRMWENMVGRSKPFWNYFFPIAQSMFRESLGHVSFDEFYAAVNYVAPSYIRVEADEVTYNLHILLRFEMERAILNGDIKIADVPGEWNSRFEKYFGIKVDNDANGCLQDVHWSAGLMGYFPTYTLGNIYAAQFYAQANKDIPDLEQRVERGDLLTLREWLRENIHQHGQRYRANDLCKRITGEGLSHKPMMDYMNKKFAEVYGY